MADRESSGGPASRARLEEWKRVEQFLARIAPHSEIKRKDFKLHEELFFEGTVDGKPAGEAGSGDTAFDYVLGVFRVWYHPDPETLDLDLVREEFMAGGRLMDAYHRLQETWPSGGAYPDGFPADYGMMGGREALVMQLVCPKLDYREEVVQRNGRSQLACPGPKMLRYWCLEASHLELCRDARFYPHSPFQFLWEHLSHNVEHYPEQTFIDDPVSSGEVKRRELLRVMAEILSFDERRDASRRRPSTVAFVERVTRPSAATPAMDALWREASEQVAELRAESELMQAFYAPVEKLERKFDWPASEQRARTEQWEQA